MYKRMLLNDSADMFNASYA